MSFGQESGLLWQKTLGGEGDDQVNAIEEDESGNIYIASTIQSVTNYDILLTKTDLYGNTLWNKIIGGNGDEIAADLLLDEQGSVYVLMSSTSDESFLPDAKGYEDIVLAKFNASGQMVNLSSFGGSFIDKPSSMMLNNDGNIVIAGHTRSVDGDITNNNGQYDMLLLETTTSGDLLWQHTYGGSDEEISAKVIQLSDENYLFLGHSTSYEGAFSANIGDLDILVIKTDQQGNQLWQRLYGGFYSEYAADFAGLPNGDVVIAASTFSSDFDITYNHGGSDAWLFEIDQFGTMVWGQTYGSAGNESISALHLKENSFLVVGTSNSSWLDNHGAQDIWLYEVDATSKEIIGEALYGASGFDASSGLLVDQDGGVLIAGSTTSDDGVIQSNSGKKDRWLLKIGELANGDETETLIHPNPSNGVFYLNQLPDHAQINVRDQQGKLVIAKDDTQHFATMLDLSALPSGMYFLEIRSAERTELQRVIKN